MNIVIIGDGKVGHKLAAQLSGDDYNVTLIDKNPKRLENSVNEMDVSCVAGDGASANVQKRAGVPDADLVIACMSTDEINLISCLLAKKLGAKKTAARVRNPVYHEHIRLLKDDLKLDLPVNPEYVLAERIARVLIFPSAAKVETFAHGRVELVEVTLSKEGGLDGIAVVDIYRKFQVKMLVCAVQRGTEVYIPDGSFVLKAGDRIYITGSHQEIEKFFIIIKNKRSRCKNVMICGGGRVTFYLAQQLIAIGMRVKIVEQDHGRCLELCGQLPKATVINGDAADHELLEEEGLSGTDAFVAVTGSDEENVIMSIYADSRGVGKVVTKVNNDAISEMVESLGLESIVSAKNVTADVTAGYVRALINSMGSANVETVYKLVGGRVEAVEFFIREKTGYIGIPLKDLRLKENHLIAAIVRKNKIIIPGGNDYMAEGDSVIVISMTSGLSDLKDIFR